MDDRDNSNTRTSAGAILSDEQIGRLKTAVVVMTAVLVIGVITLIGRIIFLASNRNDASATSTAKLAPALKAEATVILPQGHEVKSVAMSGDRLLVHHVGPTGDGVIIVDLATGQVQSRVTVRRAP